MNGKLWGGRFEEKTDPLVDRFNASLAFDHRLFREDIDGSIAHCRMLAKQGIIRDSEAADIIRGLEEIRGEFERNEVVLDQGGEDIHTVVETRLIEKIGQVGEKLHIARSRNDQVALDVRIFARNAIQNLISLIREAQGSLIHSAEENLEVIMPGYTHLQRAQPVLLAHHLLAYFEMFNRDRQRLQDSLKRVNRLPLGSAALAGTTFDIDRERVARELGFEGLTENSMDAVSDRDFVLEMLSTISILMMHLSRLGEELVIWSSEEFGFVSISDAFSTGSSIMPQKKNPDIPELIRGKTGRVYGRLVSLLTTMKGLPLTYNKDMQEDKEALFDAVDTAEICLRVTSRLFGQVTFDKDRMKRATQSGFLSATDLADYLVGKGMTFREAHQIVGNLVLFADRKGKELHQLSLEEIRRFFPDAGEEIPDWLDPRKCVERRNTVGGTAPQRVKDQLKKAREALKE